MLCLSSLVLCFQIPYTLAMMGYINTNFVITDLLPWILSDRSHVTLSECFMLCHNSFLCRGITYQKSTESCKLTSFDYTTSTTVSTASIGSSTLVPGEAAWIFYHTIKECNQTDCPHEKGYTFVAEICFCVKYHKERETYNNARTSCQAEGGELIKINKQIKQAYVERYISQLDVTLESRVYIQGRKVGDDWIFDDGEIIEYFNWYATEPSAGNLETILFISTRQMYKWNDGSHGSYAFLCEVML